MVVENDKIIVINNLKNDKTYLLERITASENADLYDLTIVKIISGKTLDKLTEYEKGFLKYWSNKLIYNYERFG